MKVKVDCFLWLGSQPDSRGKEWNVLVHLFFEGIQSSLPLLTMNRQQERYDGVVVGYPGQTCERHPFQWKLFGCDSDMTSNMMTSFSWMKSCA